MPAESAKPVLSGDVTARSLAALVGIGALSAIWSVFLWGELVRARAGAAPFCPLADDAQCSALWDGAFASAVHRISGIPVAGWGLVWALVALALPLSALARALEGKTPRAVLSAVRLTAAAGVAAVCVFLAVSAAERAFCGSCFVTYLLVAGYAGIALFAWRKQGLPQLQRGARVAIGTLSAAFLLALYPGMRTPKTAAEASLAALGDAARAGSGDELGAFIATLDRVAKQTLSDALYQYRKGPALPLWTPRALLGSNDAPVRITEFTDIRCGHCAELQRALEDLKQRAPGSFSVEPRQFPLDGECNAGIQRRADPVRCLAAKAQICLEGHEQAHDYTSRLFARQSSLTAEDVFALAEPLQSKAALQQCIASEETSRKLSEDIFLAMKYEPEGTPLVLINGKKAASYPPFLYAMLLTNGAADHPAFRALPKPNPRAHVH
jgi:serine/threonine-protein kinase